MANLLWEQIPSPDSSLQPSTPPHSGNSLEPAGLLSASSPQPQCTPQASPLAGLREPTAQETSLFSSAVLPMQIPTLLTHPSIPLLSSSLQTFSTFSLNQWSVAHQNDTQTIHSPGKHVPDTYTASHQNKYKSHWLDKKQIALLPYNAFCARDISFLLRLQKGASFLFYLQVTIFWFTPWQFLMIISVSFFG